MDSPGPRGRKRNASNRGTQHRCAKISPTVQLSAVVSLDSLKSGRISLTLVLNPCSYPASLKARATARALTSLVGATANRVYKCQYHPIGGQLRLKRATHILIDWYKACKVKGSCSTDRISDKCYSGSWDLELCHQVFDICVKLFCVDHLLIGHLDVLYKSALNFDVYNRLK